MVVLVTFILRVLCVFVAKLNQRNYEQTDSEFRIRLHAINHTAINVPYGVSSLS